MPILGEGSKETEVGNTHPYQNPIAKNSTTTPLLYHPETLNDTARRENFYRSIPVNF